MIFFEFAGNYCRIRAMADIRGRGGTLSEQKERQVFAAVWGERGHRG
jgi:hypothetical protein